MQVLTDSCLHFVRSFVKLDQWSMEIDVSLGADSLVKYQEIINDNGSDALKATGVRNSHHRSCNILHSHLLVRKAFPPCYTPETQVLLRPLSITLYSIS